MGVISTSNFAKDLVPGVRTWFGTKYKEYPIEYKEIFETVKSGRAYEEEAGVTGFGLAAIKTEGGGIAYDSQEQGFVNRYVNITYGLGFIITREMYEDGIAVTVALRRANALAFSIRQTKEIIGANVLNRAFNSSYTMGANSDGKELCATDHPNKSGGTWRNELEVAADLSEEALEQACIDIAALKTDRGLTIAIMPQQLIIPPALEFEAMRILESLGQSGTANNDVNALRASKKFPKGIAVNHYLTDSNNWFIKTNCPDGLKYMERRADAFGTENDFDTENAKFKATFRGSFGWTDPRGIFGSEPA
jgi:phage major head subunit gpT-like protein